MPDLGSPITSTRQISYGFVDTRGITRSTSVRIGNNVFVGGELAALSAASGAISNAGIYRETERFERSTPISGAAAVDESESSVNTVLVVVMENSSAVRETYALPAPDVSILDQNREQLIVGDVGAVAGTPEKLAGDFRAALLAAVNNSFTPVNSFTIVRSYVTSYTGRGSGGSKELPGTLLEGGDAGAPPDAPAT